MRHSFVKVNLTCPLNRGTAKKMEQICCYLRLNGLKPEIESYPSFVKTELFTSELLSGIAHSLTLVSSY